MRLFAGLAIVLVIAGCVSGSADSVPSLTSDIRARATIVPSVDHHQHLLGPTAVQRAPAALATVELPPELRRLLDERARIAGAATIQDVRAIFTSEAQVLTWDRPSRWVRGEEALLAIVNGVVRQPYVYKANSYAISGSSGYVAGVVAVTVDGQDYAALDFILGVRRGADGRWRIEAESTTIKTPPLYGSPITGEQVVSDLDAAGIDRAVVLSVAFWMGSRFPDAADEMTREYAAVRAENDWVAEQVSRYPTRLVMACSANVLRRYAVQELERCAQLPANRAFKLHFADSNVDLRTRDHVAAIQQFFAAANTLRMPLIIHFAPRAGDFDREYVNIFLNEIVSAAPDIPIQIAHLGGDGPGLTAPRGTQAFAEVMQAGDPRARNLYFDIAGLVTRNLSAEAAEEMAQRLREMGLGRILYASDGQGPNEPTAVHWTQTRLRLPLTESELSIVANNVAPYMTR